ncbi:hypothetical protein [Pararhizobium mangrovi]|uniref:Nucleoside 2-deoxyribosyltransferase n=1 Tax=Pararhizobium mangrovi TaxID=2590452 RepID=A0A506TWJ2_9HYPH|nr:hypothetical protein [Pararhizobium mangrovi]TPW25850.1 hypothetical protein FJU11_17480 [Pararhizobium mangrovi]
MATKKTNNDEPGGKEADQRKGNKKPECFVIMPISDHPDYRTGHFRDVYDSLIRPVVEDAGYECTRADEVSASDMIHVNVVRRLIQADLVICDLSTKNPNVLFEYGIRQAFDYPAVLIKDDVTNRIFDLSAFRDIEYDHTLRYQNVITAQTRLHDAIRETTSKDAQRRSVFSLIQLANIGKAAQPPAHSDKDDQFTAYLQILDGRISEVQDLLYREREIRRSNSITARASRQYGVAGSRSESLKRDIPPLRTGGPSRVGDLLISLNEQGAVIATTEGITNVFADPDEFIRSPITAELDSETTNQILNHLMGTASKM